MEQEGLEIPAIEKPNLLDFDDWLMIQYKENEYHLMTVGPVALADATTNDTAVSGSPKSKPKKKGAWFTRQR